LLLSGLLYDPQWIPKFLSNSQEVSARTLGAQSTVYGFAYLGCGQNNTCTQVAGTAAALILLALGALYLWRNRIWLSAWEAFSVMVPLGFLSTLYLWSYDQLLYIIPIVWIATTLLARTRSYLPVFGFLILIDAVSLIALAVQAATHQDLLSLVTTLLVLGLCLWLQRQAMPSSGRRDAHALRPS
jgi:hypothetical protein